MNAEAATPENEEKAGTTQGWPIKDVWVEYEKIAIHFNDLLIKLRTQALAAVAAITTLAGIFGKSSSENQINWGLAAAVLFFLCLFWIAVWIIDFRYYNRLLLGAVDAIIDLEERSKEHKHVFHIEISTKIESAVEGKSSLHSKEKQKKYARLSEGRWAFYMIIFGALLIGLEYSLIQHIS